MISQTFEDFRFLKGKWLSQNNWKEHVRYMLKINRKENEKNKNLMRRTGFIYL